jgi:hypothetical protein
METGTTTESEVSTVTQTSETADRTDRRSTTGTERIETQTATQKPTPRNTETPIKVKPEKEIQQYTTFIGSHGSLDKKLQTRFKKRLRLSLSQARTGVLKSTQNYWTTR